MTAQINDIFVYNNNSLTLAGISGKELFNPSLLGMDPVGTCSACWRGYQAIYALTSFKLVLDTLHTQLFSDRGKYIDLKGPLINGVPPIGANDENDWFNNHYYSIDHHLDYTGGLLLTSGFIEELYVHMGFHPAWKYEFVFELIFSKGILKKEHDRSKQIANIRNKIQLSRMEDSPSTTLQREEIQEMVDGSFKRTYRMFQ